MLTTAETLRQTVHKATDRTHKSAMGQFMTPASVAAFMASMFPDTEQPIHLLDPGAGLGALTSAVQERLGEPASIDAWELDPRLASHLELALPQATVHRADFLAAQMPRRFTHCCMNPPYKKIGVDSLARGQARAIGLETVNLYSAFVGVVLTMMKPGGQVVAILPRSFANGPYYKPFRRFLLERAAIRRIHLFESRAKAFSDDDVLQENVILQLEVDGRQGPVVVSTSTDDTFDDLRLQTHPFADIVQPDDEEAFIRMPTQAADPLDRLGFSENLADLGLTVSTGRVVDFRMRDHLQQEASESAAPLIYAHHVRGTDTTWPISDAKKPNAILVNDDTRRWLVPNGLYVVLRRFSAKEEKRRLVPSLLDGKRLGPYQLLGIENHLNYFHANKQPLTVDLAWGLFVYLSSTVLDDHLRRFSGHTQINATDLRAIRYPNRKTLEAWGRWARHARDIDQQHIDEKVEA